MLKVFLRSLVVCIIVLIIHLFVLVPAFDFIFSGEANCRGLISVDAGAGQPYCYNIVNGQIPFENYINWPITALYLAINFVLVYVILYIDKKFRNWEYEKSLAK